MESTGLKSQRTFENLKIDGLDLSVMSAKAITKEKFARMYNPLFLHGETESTRAHLLHAIGNEFRKLYPKKVAIYTSGKKLLADFKKLSLSECFKKYHGYNVVLIDGVDEIVLGNEQVEKFVALLEKQVSRDGQIVFTAGGDIKVLQAVARGVMRDKFPMGMMVEIRG